MRVADPVTNVRVKDPVVVVSVGWVAGVLALAAAVIVVKPLLDRHFVVADIRIIAVQGSAEASASFKVKVLSFCAWLPGAFARAGSSVPVISWGTFLRTAEAPTSAVVPVLSHGAHLILKAFASACFRVVEEVKGTNLRSAFAFAFFKVEIFVTAAIIGSADPLAKLGIPHGVRGSGRTWQAFTDAQHIVPEPVNYLTVAIRNVFASIRDAVTTAS